jgi:hypothetical protein
MIQEPRKPSFRTRRQISLFLPSETNVLLSLFGEVRACMHWPNLVGDLSTIGTACRQRGDLGAGNSSASRTAAVTSEPGTTGNAQNTHACNHTKKFISYKSHFAMDAKYLIMANAVMPAGTRKCDGAKPVSAAINQRG